MLIGGQLQIQKLANAGWQDLGTVTETVPEDAIEEIADAAEIYRVREADSDDPWRFFYVDEDGRATDSGALSHL